MKQADLGLDVEQLTERQDWLQSSARALMDEVGLRAILETAGRVWPGGSFDLGLMVWPDLDIEVITTCPPQPAVVINVLRDLVLRTGFARSTMPIIARHQSVDCLSAFTSARMLSSGALRGRSISGSSTPNRHSSDE